MLIEAKAVSHAFGDRAVLRSAACHVASGEFVALVGPSGSGKSTLMFVMSGLLDPDSGSVSHDWGGALRDQVSWAPQTGCALGLRSALDNVAIAVLARRRPRSEARDEARRLLGVVGLSERCDAPARVLSGGERQRLNLARALANGREFIFADEPTASLDASNTADVIELLRTAATVEGKGVFVATHDLAVADAADRVVSL